MNRHNKGSSDMRNLIAFMTFLLAAGLGPPVGDNDVGLRDSPVARDGHALVNGVVPTRRRAIPDDTVPEEADQRIPELVLGVVVLHEIGVEVPQVGLEREEFLTIGRKDFVVPVEPHDVLASGLGEGEVPGCRKVIDPDEVVDRGPELSGDRLGLVRRTGVDDHDLVSDALDTTQAAGEGFFLVLHDHGQREERRGHARSIARAIGV